MENSHDPAGSAHQSDVSPDVSPDTTDTAAAPSADSAAAAPQVFTPAGSSAPATDPVSSAVPPAADSTPVVPTTAATAPAPSLTMHDSTAQGSVQLPPAGAAPAQKHASWKLAVYIVVGLAVLGGASFGSYLAGKHAAHPAPVMADASSVKKVPAGATIIEQCEPGLGTQYVLPKDIPNGPVYNVYKGKLIGIEYMTDLAELEKLNTVLDNLPLYSQTYDHINIMSMPAHSGFPTPHYQVDVMMVPASTTKQITCGGAAPDMMSKPSGDNTSTTTMNSGMHTDSTSPGATSDGM